MAPSRLAAARLTPARYEGDLSAPGQGLAEKGVKLGQLALAAYKCSGLTHRLLASWSMMVATDR
jgi:hypothetical protein